MRNLWGIFTLLCFGIFFLLVISTIGQEAGEKNPYLDDKSVDLIVSLNYEYSQFNTTSVEEQTSDVTENSSFEDVDAFARQYLEDKSDIAQKKSTLEKIYALPDVSLRVLGIENNAILTAIKTLIGAILVFVIFLAGYKAISSKEVDN